MLNFAALFEGNALERVDIHRQINKQIFTDNIKYGVFSESFQLILFMAFFHNSSLLDLIFYLQISKKKIMMLHDK